MTQFDIARDIISQEWDKAVKEWELKPGNISEKILARIVKRIDDLNAPIHKAD
jgi:hypothetical protein